MCLLTRLEGYESGTLRPQSWHSHSVASFAADFGNLREILVLPIHRRHLIQLPEIINPNSAPGSSEGVGRIPVANTIPVPEADTQLSGSRSSGQSADLLSGYPCSTIVFLALSSPLPPSTNFDGVSPLCGPGPGPTASVTEDDPMNGICAAISAVDEPPRTPLSDLVKRDRFCTLSLVSTNLFSNNHQSLHGTSPSVDLMVRHGFATSVWTQRPHMIPIDPILDGAHVAPCGMEPGRLYRIVPAIHFIDGTFHADTASIVRPTFVRPRSNASSVTGKPPPFLRLRCSAQSAVSSGQTAPLSSFSLSERRASLFPRARNAARSQRMCPNILPLFMTEVALAYQTMFVPMIETQRLLLLRQAGLACYSLKISSSRLNPSRCLIASFFVWACTWMTMSPPHSSTCVPWSLSPGSKCPLSGSLLLWPVYVTVAWPALVARCPTFCMAPHQ